MAELQKIKREKANEEREKEELRKQEEERIRYVNSLQLGFNEQFETGTY
jgi:hypothetical protein